MTLETAPIVLGPWLLSAGQSWLATLFLGGIGALILVYLGLMLGHGPMAAGERLVTGLLAAADDLIHTSPRRVFALAWLAIQESLRRRALAGFAVFLILLAFALWFLDTETYDPTALYLSFVLWATTILSLILALFISVFSLPNDLKNKTIYTIVTKPVRSSEIVLGRILGFAAIGTAQLAVMGVISYVFVVRALNHTHEIGPDDMKIVESTRGGITREAREGRTSKNRGHFHVVTDHGEGAITTDEKQGHWHPVTVTERGGKQLLALGAPQGQFHARVPVYGSLRFRDNAGNEKKQGTNVGKVWTYRGYVEGGSLAAALWTFHDVTPDRFAAGLPVDLNIRVFRTFKGEVEKGIVGSIVLRNPRTKVASAPRNFIAKEFILDRHNIPRKLVDPSGKPLDLFDDLVADGELELQLTCLQRGMFFGMAQPDVYLLAREGSVLANFVKGYVSIWYQMVLVISFGVLWSTFLNGAVAMLATFGVMLGGFFRSDMLRIAKAENYGGATFESLYRIASKKNVMESLDTGAATDAIKGADEVVRWVLKIVCQILPDFKEMSSLAYLADGFDVPWERLTAHGCMTLAFAVPVFLIGFLCFRAREVAA